MKQSTALEIMKSGKNVFLTGQAGCYDKDTEYLSPTGWKKFPEYIEGELVAQFDTHTEEVTFVHPEQYIKLPCEEFTRMSFKGIDMCLSSEHNVLYYNRGYEKPKTIVYSDLLQRHSESKDGFSGSIRTTFKYSGKGIDYTEGELRLQVAVMADGRIVKNGKNNYTQMRFYKERKYQRLIDLCNKFNLPYIDNGWKVSDKSSSGKEYELIVFPKTVDKHFDSKYYQCTNEQLSIITDEIKYWDSTIVNNIKKINNTIRFSTTIKDSATFIQFAFSSQGYCTSILYRKKDSNSSIEYTVNASQSRTNNKGLRSPCNKDRKLIPEIYKSLDGFKYCFTVPSGFLLVRRNNKIFISGNSGKSYTLNQFIRHLHTNKIPVAITASTGIASTLVNGSTIHSFASIGIKDTLTAADIHNIRMRAPISSKIKAIKVLIIDEISMLHYKQFEMVSYVLKSIRNDYRPFGGVQIIVAGDFYQLPPVGNEDISKRFAFMSRAWVEAQFNVCYLTEQHRQSNSELTNILNSIRDNTVNDNIISLLDSKIVDNDLNHDDSTKLYTHNLSVDNYNNKKNSSLEGDSRLYKAKTTGTESNVRSLVTNILSPPELELKVGSRVMFTKNSPDGDYVNGTIGTVTKMSANSVIVKTLDDKLIGVERQEWVKEDMYGSVIATYNQLPLKLSWAVTVHKCIHPDTLVSIKHDEWIPIKDIPHSGEILTDSNIYNRYDNKVSNPIRNGIEITTQYGFKISVTHDHKCKVESATGFTYVEASTLELNDRLKMLSSIFNWKHFDDIEKYRKIDPNYFTLINFIRDQVWTIGTIERTSELSVPRDILPPSSLQRLQILALSNGILLDLSNPNSLNIPYSFKTTSLPLFLPVKSLRPIILESMCVTVPETGSFIQNGFDMSNCQGMTLDSALIDLRSTFEYGQGYVALSRLKDLDGLSLLGYNPTSLELHPLARKADQRFRELSENLEKEFLQ